MVDKIYLIIDEATGIKIWQGEKPPLNAFISDEQWAELVAMTPFCRWGLYKKVDANE